MDRFVVGSGRCGSTLLTTLLGTHPEVLVMSEFFITLDPVSRFLPEPRTGADFAALLDKESFVVPIIRERSVHSKENLGSFVPEATRVPPLMVSTLPMLSDDPVALHKEVLDVVAGFPTQPFRDHYYGLFRWLLQRTGTSVWIERSGPSNEYLPKLVETFPDGKFVHLHRDGRETALSMQRNPHYQLAVSFFHDPPSREELLATEYGGGRPSPQDTLSRRLSPDRLSSERYAEWWSYTQLMAFRGLSRLAPEQVLDVRFEHLVTSPAEVLGEIAEFFELPVRGGWIAEAAESVKPPPVRFDGLPEELQAAVAKACEPGEFLLDRRPPRSIQSTLDLLDELSADRAAGSRSGVLS